MSNKTVVERTDRMLNFNDVLLESQNAYYSRKKQKICSCESCILYSSDFPLSVFLVTAKLNDWKLVEIKWKQNQKKWIQ